VKRISDMVYISEQDKNRIKILLDKPWNPYIRSALSSWDIFPNLNMIHDSDTLQPIAS
jgi:hypothetical protein